MKILERVPELTDDQLNQLEANAQRRAGTWEADEVLEAIAAERLRRTGLSGDETATEETAAAPPEEATADEPSDSFADHVTEIAAGNAGVPEPDEAAPAEAEQPAVSLAAGLRRHKQFKGTTPEELRAAIQQFETRAQGWTNGRDIHRPHITRRGLVVTRLYLVTAPGGDPSFPSVSTPRVTSAEAR